MIQCESAVYIWLACLLLLLPLDWLLAAMLAAIFHESCHLLVLLLLGGRIGKIRISLTGCVIESSSPGDWQSACGILAGPAGSILLLLASETAPKIAVCGLFHGLYNLLPILPLDGGRLLQLLLYRLLPEKAEPVLLWTGRIICIMLLFTAIYLSAEHRLGMLPVILTILWILRLFPRKIPCKQLQIGVQ